MGHLLTLFGGTKTYSEKIQATPGLIGYWPLDEAAGVVAYDRSGNGRNGAHTGVTFNAPGANLISNGGFETAGAGGADVLGTWGEQLTNGTVERTVVAGEFMSGVAACKLTAGAAVDARIAQSVTVIPGQTYNLTFWTRGDGTYQGRRLLQDATNGYANIGSVTPTGVTNTTYAQVTAQVTAPAGCFALSVVLMCPATNGGIAYFDDVSLIATTPNGIGDGRNAPYYDGVNDYTNIYGASLAGAFNGAEGTLIAWAKVSGAGVWTDGVVHEVIRLQADAGNAVNIFKAANNQIYGRYIAGTTNDSSTVAITPTGWMCLALTWSKSGDALKLYVNGPQQGAAAATLGTWAGALAGTTTVIGAASTTPTYVWPGNIAHVSLYNRALSAAEIAALSRV